MTNDGTAFKKCKGEIRQMSRDRFFQTLRNGEKMLRPWMMYSPSKISLYCFCCRLFAQGSKEQLLKIKSPSRRARMESSSLHGVQPMQRTGSQNSPK